MAMEVLTESFWNLVPFDSMSQCFISMVCLHIIQTIGWKIRNVICNKKDEIGQPDYGIRKPHQETDHKDEDIYPVIIVGGGAAGLACAQQLSIAQRMKCLILEAGDCCGGAWKGRYKRLHLHTTKKISHLPDLKMPDHYPTFPSQQQVYEYLEAYAKYFNLQIHLSTKVISSHFDQQSNLWNITAEQKKTVLNNKSNELMNVTEIVHYKSKFMIVATAANSVSSPNIPNFNKRELFQKTLFHSSEYYSGESFKNQKVLIIGIGNSGAEIALDLWEYGAEPSIMVRSPMFIIPRWLAQQTQDRPWPSWMKQSRILPLFIHDTITSIALYFTMGSLSKYGLNNKIHKLMSTMIFTKQPPLMDIGTIDLIKNNQIKIIQAPSIKEYSKNGVILSDDREIVCDAIIMATGYNKTGSFTNWLDVNILSKIEKAKEEESPEQYNTKYSSLFGGSGAISRFHPKLAFCGFNDFTGLIQEVRLESQVLAHNIKHVLLHDNQK